MLRGVNLPVWLRGDPATDAAFTPSALAQPVAAGLGAMRVLPDPTPVLRGVSVASALAWSVKQAVLRCLAAQATTVIVALAPEEGVLGADQICGDIKLWTTYIKLCQEIVHALVGLPASVLFEPMNEPQSWDDPGLWNAKALTLYRACQFSDPARGLVMEAASSSWPDQYAAFDPTPFAANQNVVFSSHWYGLNNTTFSGQSTPWDPALAGLSGIPWPAQADTVTRDMANLSAWAAKHRIAPSRIWVTEFGCLRFADSAKGCALADVVRFMSDVRASAETLGFGALLAFGYSPTDFIASPQAFSLLLTDGSGRWQPEILAALTA